jgi:hypothetical protein
MYERLAIVTLDFIDFFAFANLAQSTLPMLGSGNRGNRGNRKDENEERIPPEDLTTQKTKHWIKGNSLISAKTSSCGVATLTARHTSGKTMWNVRMYNDLSISLGGSHHSSSSSFTSRNLQNSKTALDPESLLFRLQKLVGTLETQDLISSEALDRALTVFDRTPCLDTHKIGLIYVGKCQTRQEDILANKDGSPKFVKLLQSLGTFVKLSECRAKGWYTGGLDCDTGSDGEFGLFWKDQCTQVVFHVPVMQQSTSSGRMTIPGQAIQNERNAVNNKKRHIGNDYVHIVYSNNEDSLSYPYRQDTITGQFNFVHIVVRPSGESYYSIEMKTKEELQEVGLFPSFQIAHETYMADIVREMALSADLACGVFHGRGMDYLDNKLERLNQIQRIRERLVRK